MSNRGYTPDLSCRPSRCVLLKLTAYTCASVSFSTMVFATKNEDIVMAFSLLVYSRFFSKKKRALQRGGHGHPRTPQDTPSSYGDLFDCLMLW